MSATGKSLTRLFMALALCVAGCWLWGLHARAWDLGERSPVLNYDTSQYALAARELADHGRLATTFALPLELSRHAQPPWPLAVVQPGLVLLEAGIFKLVPPSLSLGGRQLYWLGRPDQREWLALIVPLLCYLTLGAALALGVVRILARNAPALTLGQRVLAGFVIGLAALLDPEAQHFAVGGFTELPFTLGLTFAVMGLALEGAPRRPLAFGLLLGITGSFRVNMLWLAPLLCLGAGAIAPPGRRLRVTLVALAGYVVPAAPWWFYKWRVFGSPGWDLTRFVVWDGVGGLSWSTIFHLPDPPALPSGPAAIGLLAAKTARNLPPLLLAVFTGPRALWLGALVAWLVVVRRPRALVVTGLVVIATFALGVLSAAVSIPWLRYVFPARIVLEAAGMLALWGLISRLASPAPDGSVGAQGRWTRVLAVGVAAVALGWGTFASIAGNAEAHATASDRSLPGVATLLATGVLMNRDIPAGEPVMSNLGPALAWHARRPVIHLALAPADLEACRRRLDFRHVILVYRDPGRAGPGWSEIVARPQQATHDPELNIVRAREWRSADGFSIVWLELGPLKPRLALAPAAPMRDEPGDRVAGRRPATSAG